VIRLTETRRAVLELISDGRPLSAYVPSYRPGAHRGFGAFPLTIANRAARDLVKAGLVRHTNGEPSHEITEAGRLALERSKK